MNIGDRLRQLRGEARPESDDALATRLQRLRPPARHATMDPDDCSVLGTALAAEQTTDGLLIRERHYRLSPASCVGVDPSALPETCRLPPLDWLYIDTETTGLSSGVGNLAFMIGVARFSATDQLEVRQYVLGRYAAERAMLTDLLATVGTASTGLVSYNGKSFDLPLLANRCRMQRVAARIDTLPHLDLMYTVRRAYRRHWPDCRLQTAERRLLGLQRVDDLPGAQAPAAWRTWLCERDTAAIARVLEHNFQDVVSLALLHRCLAGAYLGQADSPLDHAAIGRAWLDAGDPQRAQRIWENAGESLSDDGRLDLARLYRRQGDWASAETQWLALYARGNAAASLELSKLHEHRRRDLRAAMRYAGSCTPDERNTRCSRLRRKLDATPQLTLRLSLRTR
ncbi:MAG: ribonuclease H-like domain-containing protein [Gammaproteobacteria bacterium]|nr:ribonuclease H-like domain-containing protein [Gammaproteobacteria bacterium]